MKTKILALLGMMFALLFTSCASQSAYLAHKNAAEAAAIAKANPTRENKALAAATANAAAAASQEAAAEQQRMAQQQANSYSNWTFFGKNGVYSGGTTGGGFGGGGNFYGGNCGNYNTGGPQVRSQYNGQTGYFDKYEWQYGRWVYVGYGNSP